MLIGTSRKLRVLHVIPSLSPQDGGPTFALVAIARALLRADTEITILTTERRGEPAGSGGIEPELEGVEIVRLPRTIEPYKVSFALIPWMLDNLSSFDLVHVHALFSFSSVVAAWLAQRKKIPYVVRPLGVLNRWGMERRRPVLKKLSFRLIERPILLKSAAIHYTSTAEKREAEQLAGSLAEQRTTIIPLPVDTTLDTADGEIFYQRFPATRDKQIILYLSRLDRKKGLELLLPAFGELSKRLPGTIMAIAGDGVPEYVGELKALGAKVALADRIIWCGFLSGPDKQAAFAVANVFVLPSRSENFGVAAAEALAAGVPTIVTQDVGLAFDILAHEAGLVVESDKTALADAIFQLLTETDKANRLATNARRLMRESYSEEAVGSQLRRLYDSILQA